MKLRLTLAVCVLVVFLQAGQGASDTDAYRLPQTCKPSEYELHIRPDFYDANAKPTFSGSVNITVTCSASTNQMTLHQRNLCFQEVTVTSNGIELPFHGKENTALDFYTLVLGNGLKFKANVPYKLSFTFSGVMGTSSGLFYSSYVSVQGQTVGLAATQLLPNNARSVFPCFDEPGFKATFFTSIARRTDTGRDYSTLFNTALDKSEVDPKDPRWTVDVYGPTPLMSTYLVALVVSDFTGYTKNIDLGKLHSGQENGSLLSIRTLGDPGSKGELFEIHHFGGKSFSWMDTHFLPTYEKFLSKIDIVAVPDYPLPSLDSWGVIQCRSSDVKYTRFLTPMQTIEKLMVIPYNTIANQWFSSIVSPKWWTYYWMSAGFSTFWQYYGPQQVHPNWKQDELIVSRREMVTMQKDGSTHSRPLNNPVQIPNTWHLSNQYTTYKGSAVVRMLHMILGEHFLPALNHYLTKHELKAVDSDDLWTALDEYGIEHGLDLQLSERMPPWVEQIGYPVLWANRNKDQERVALTQEIFPVEHRNTDFNQPFGDKFDIPIQLVTDEDIRRRDTSTHPPEWFSRNHCIKTIQVGKDVSWYVVNEDHRGYYRVLYDEDNYEKLYDQLMNDHEVFTPLTRATILDDALTFFRSEDKFRLAVKAWPFVLTRYLKKELSFPAWEVFRREMEHYRLRLMFADSSLFQSFNDFIQSITGPVLKSLDLTVWIDVPPYDSYIRTWVAELACRSRERYCVEYAESAVMGLIEDDEPLNVDQKEALYCGALGGNMTKSHTVFKFLVDRLPKVKGSDKKKYLSILGCIRDPRLVVWLLTSALNGHIPGLESGGDMWLLLHQFAFSWSPSHTTLEFLVDNFDSILQRINDRQQSYYLLEDVFEYLTENTDQERILTPLLNNMMRMEFHWFRLAQNTRIGTFRKNNEYLNKNLHIFEAWLDTNI